MNLELNIDPKQINEYMAKQCLESGIGEALKQNIKKAVEGLSNSWNNPFEAIVQTYIRQELARLIREDFGPDITEKIKKSITPEVLDKLINTAVSKITYGDT